MKRRIYQVLPRLWGDGRFSSFDEASLSYVKGLGMTDVWFTGIIRHATKKTDGGCIPSPVVKGEAGSPYAITDYYDVNPYLADNPSERMSEFEDLLRRSHAAGLRVLIDFVPNHVARDYHTQMPGKASFGDGDDPSVHWREENDFYYYPGEALRLPFQTDYREYPARASGNCFSPAPGMNDWWDTVRLNYCPTRTRTWDRMYDIVRFWAEKGVDGFRCDMVELVPPAFFTWLIRRVKTEFPHVAFIAEVYQKELYRKYIEEVGFDLLYDKSGLYDTLRAIACNGAPATGITAAWQSLGDLQPRMLNFLENHDEQRLASDFFLGDAGKAFPLLAVSLLFNDASFMLYAGEEIGERGMDDEPFSGVNGRTSIFDWWKVSSLQRLYSELHGKQVLTDDERALLRRYEAAFRTADEPAFLQGKTFDLGYCQPAWFNRTSLFAFLRSDGARHNLIVANFSPTPQSGEIVIPEEASAFLGMEKKVFCVKWSAAPSDYTVIAI